MIHDITPTQVLALCKTKFHYYLFMVVLVGKKKILRADLQKSFKDIDALDSVVNDLLNAQLFKEEDNCKVVTCISFNVKFPSIKQHPQLEAYYKKLDLWDLQFPETFKFANLVSKVFIKKLNPVTIHRIQAALEKTLATIADEINNEKDNDDKDSQIVHMQVVFNKGNIKL